MEPPMHLLSPEIVGFAAVGFLISIQKFSIKYDIPNIFEYKSKLLKSVFIQASPLMAQYAISIIAWWIFMYSSIAITITPNKLLLRPCVTSLASVGIFLGLWCLNQYHFIKYFGPGQASRLLTCAQTHHVH